MTEHPVPEKQMVLFTDTKVLPDHSKKETKEKIKIGLTALITP